MRGNKLQQAGSSTFKSPGRKAIFGADNEKPGPGEYNSSKDFGHHNSKSQKHNLAFGHKMRRFNPDDTLSPGPGAYVAPDSVQIHDEKRGIASYKSTLERKETQVVPGGDAPGVGLYLTDKHKSLGYQEIEGGAPNNFLFLYRAKNPAVPVNSDPRLPETVNISKSPHLIV